MQSLRWRRVAAGLIDFAPLTLAVFLVTPLLLTIVLIACESHLGVGLFDPKTGSDPGLPAQLNARRLLPLGVLIGALGWVAAEVVALAQQRGSIGQIVGGLMVQRHDGRPASLARRLLRGSLRQTLALALLVTAAVATRPGPAVAARQGSPELPRRYAAHSPNPPAPPLNSADHLAPVILALASVLTLVLAIDLGLALLGARALGDRLAGTAVRRR